MEYHKKAFLDARLFFGGSDRKQLAAEYDRTFGRLTFEAALKEYLPLVPTMRLVQTGGVVALKPKPKSFAHKIISSKPIPKP